MTDNPTTEFSLDDIEYVDESQVEWPEVRRVEFDLIATVDANGNLGDGLDVLAGTLGRYGIEGFTIMMRDVDDDSRSWVLKQGRLYTTDEFVAEFEAAADEAALVGSPLTAEEEEAIRQSDLPVTTEAENDRIEEMSKDDDDTSD